MSNAPALRIESLINSDAVKKRFQELLGKHAAGFISSVISATKANKALSECEPMSVISAAAIAASLDLPINPSLGFAHIVPYKGIAQFQIGWKGFVQLAMRSGQYKSMNATTVLEGQLVKWNRFTGEMEFQDEAKSDTVIGYLLYFKLNGGFEKYFYMTAEQCEAHGKRYSKSYAKGTGQWKENFDSMALKTVVKQGLSKYGTLSIDMRTAIVMDQAVVPTLDAAPVYIDQQADALVPGEADNVTADAGAKKSTPSRLAQATAVTAQKSHSETSSDESDRIASLVDHGDGDSKGSKPLEPPSQAAMASQQSIEPSVQG